MTFGIIYALPCELFFGKQGLHCDTFILKKMRKKLIFSVRIYVIHGLISNQIIKICF